MFVPTSASGGVSPETSPVCRLTWVYGMPVGDSVNAGSSRSVMSRAWSSSQDWPVHRYPASSPPTSRMIASKTWKSASTSKDRLFCSQSVAACSSLSSSITYSVSSASIIDSPTGWPSVKNSLAVPDTGFTSSWPQA
jgi:hypothetical protein